jgi:hypothetical protein
VEKRMVGENGSFRNIRLLIEAKIGNNRPIKDMNVAVKRFNKNP